MTTWRALLAEAAAEVGRDDARRLVEEASGYDGGELWLHIDEEASARSGAYLTQMVERRRTGEPLQYVVGRWGFRQLDLMVDHRVLIPRPETEEVVDWAIDAYPGTGRVLDLGTGSGAIALAIATELRAEVWATDVSAAALDVARANLAGVGMWAGSRVRLLVGHWYDAVPEDLRGTFGLVVSNPPYVGQHDPLPDEVRLHEPEVALRSGADGLDDLRLIVAGAPPWLCPGGALVCEIGAGHRDAVIELAHAAGFTGVEVRADASGRPRGLVARWSP